MSFSECFASGWCNTTGSFQNFSGDGYYHYDADQDATILDGVGIIGYGNIPPYGDGIYINSGCYCGCDDPSAVNHCDGTCDACGYYDCAGNIYYPAYGDTSCASVSKDYWGNCCGSCFDPNACSATGGNCDYGSGSANCGCNNIDLGCGCGYSWNGTLPSVSDVRTGVHFGGGDLNYVGALQSTTGGGGTSKNNVILSSILGIPVF